jgi:GNAT superfamily N-acetyltransferase
MTFLMEITVLPNGIALRTARLIDAPDIARVHVESWRETYRGIMTKRFLDSRTVENRTEMWQLALEQLRSDCVLLVLEEVDQGKIIGFAYGGPARDGSEQPYGELYAMYILKHYQGRGLGRLLFAAFMAALQELGLDQFYGLVLQGNRSRGFFVKMGGRSRGIDPGTLSGRRGGRGLADERFEWG